SPRSIETLVRRGAARNIRDSVANAVEMEIRAHLPEAVLVEPEAQKQAPALRLWPVLETRAGMQGRQIVEEQDFAGLQRKRRLDPIGEAVEHVERFEQCE